MLEINQKSLTVPLIQGGMGVGVSLGSLAGHVAKCGAMGVISTAHPGYKEDDFESNHRQANIRALKKEILKAQKLSQGKGLVAINAMVALKDYEELINAALESKVDAIISGAGLPLRLPELVKDHDVLIAPIVSSGKACKVIIKHWLKKYQRTPDFIVIEGSKAGGHLGFKKEDLEKQIREITNIDIKEYLITRIDEINQKLNEICQQREELTQREANKKIGYVYIISNIGAFGENVYKIGMTRRLEPKERISELSGASVPFKFDIHAMIFSEDAPALEAKLHRAFADKKVLSLIHI